MADVVGTIVSFFRNKGLPDKIIAAILGNMQQESGFRTDALNGGEGAIGLAQWEGGRRTALQQYARDHGTSETDLKTQLNFMWDHELASSPYNHVLAEMNAAPSAGAAAAIWDQEYEVSSGSSRNQRMANAESFASSHLSSAGVSVSSGGGSGGGGGAVMESAASTPAMTPAQKKAALLAGVGPLASLLTQIPELSQILTRAISTGMTGPEFQNAINNSKWYRTHSDTVRNSLILQASDPAAYNQLMGNSESKIQMQASQLGVKLSGAQAYSIAYQAQLHGWDSNQIQHSIAQYWTQDSGQPMGPKSGQAATILDQMNSLAADYGIPISRQASIQWAQKILSGGDNIDGFKNYAIATASSMYPSLAAQLKGGMTTKSIADPYIQTKANLLEIDPNTINWTKDLGIKQALQGTGAAAATGGQPTATPLWQFEQQVKSDPRWQLTRNAHADTSNLLEQLGHDWGYSAV